MKKPKKPEDIPKLFVKNWNKRRTDLMAELFEEDADFINVVGLWCDNRQDIYEAHDYGLRVIFKDSTLKVVKLKTKKLSDGAAVVHAKMNLTGQTAVEGQEGG